MVVGEFGYKAIAPEGGSALDRIPLCVPSRSSLFSGAREQVVQTMVRLLDLVHIADTLVLDVLLYGQQL